MARHNREGTGTDQRGFEYTVSYQPDWLQAIKVTRELAGGRQSTKTLFRNPGKRVADPPEKVRTRITSPAQKLDIEVAVTDAAQVVKRIVVECVCKEEDGTESQVAFTLLDEMPPPWNGG